MLTVLQNSKESNRFQVDRRVSSNFRGIKDISDNSPGPQLASSRGGSLPVHCCNTQSRSISIGQRGGQRAEASVLNQQGPLRGEERYPKVEKLALAVVHSSDKLSHYFQAHPIKVRTEPPLRRALHCPETLGRLVLWAIKLRAYDVQFEPRKAINAQVLADFVAECTEDPDQEEESSSTKEWQIFVDRASAESGAGAGIVVFGPTDFKVIVQLLLNFKATNNMAEYEALLAGINLAVTLKIEKVIIHSDSQLVVCQVLGLYETKEPKLCKYRAACLRSIEKLKAKGSKFNLQQIPQAANTEADELAKTTAQGEWLPNMINRILENPSCQALLSVELDEVENWMTPIMTYLRTGDLPDTDLQRRKLLRKVPHYSLIEGSLFKVHIQTVGEMRDSRGGKLCTQRNTRGNLFHPPWS